MKIINFSHFSDIGNLMKLDIDMMSPPIRDEEITPEIRKLAAKLKKQGRNYSPVMLKEISQDSYEVVGDRETFIASRLAGYEKTWGVIVPNDFDGEETKLRTDSQQSKTSLKSSQTNLESDNEIAKLKAEVARLKQENTSIQKSLAKSASVPRSTSNKSTPKKGAKKAKKCNKGYPCGGSCINKGKQCRKKMSQGAENMSNWLKNSIDSTINNAISQRSS